MKILTTVTMLAVLPALLTSAEILSNSHGTRQFYPHPGKPAQLILPTALPVGKIIKATLSDYDGKPLKQLETTVDATGILSFKETFDIGYYELKLHEQDVTLGICCQPPVTDKRDPFFAIEGLLENKGEFANDMVDVLLEHGVGHNREWYVYPAYARSENDYKENTDLYVTSGVKGLKSIVCFADFPSWYGLEKEKRTVPQHLLPLLKHSESLIGWRKQGLDALHVLNEYDLLPRPAESNLPVIKTVAYAMRQHQDLIFAAAPFCQNAAAENKIQASINNGLLDLVDVFTFHTYSAPETLETLLQTYRKALENHPKAQMPIWITESGKPWSRNLSQEQLAQMTGAYGGPKGALHPQLQEDRTSALWIAMKVVEAKCCGIQRIFPFTLPFFQENNNNFGMTDYWHSPLRSLTGYFHTVHELTGFEYTGDYQPMVGGAVRARVFSNGTHCKAVIYLGEASANQTRVLSLAGMPITALRLLDGRSVKQNASGSVTVTGGLLFADLDATAITTHLNTQTTASRLRAAALAYKPIPRVCSPVVYQFRFWDCQERDTMAYQLKDGKFNVRLYNFGDNEITCRPEIVLPQGGHVVASPFQNATVTLPPHSERDVTWNLDITAVESAFFDIQLKDAIVPNTGISVPILNLTNTQSVSWELNDIQRWKHNSSGKTTASFDYDKQAMRFDTDFTKAKTDYWVFPEYHLKLPEESVDDIFAIEFDIAFDFKNTPKRITSPLVMLAYQTPDGSTPYDSFSYGTPIQGWKHCHVSLSHAPGRNYNKLRIGCCTTRDSITFWLKNIVLIRKNNNQGNIMNTLPQPIKIADNHRSFITEDGKPFFYLGDTAWELFHRLTFDEACTYLKNRAAKGFNVIQAVALAECNGIRQPNRNGDLPFVDENPAQPNEPYWNHVDAVVSFANSLGLTVGLLPTWGDKWNKAWGEGPVIFTPENAGAYGEWIANRYRNAAIIWILGGDRAIENDTHFAINEAMAQGIRKGDGGTHLITFHPCGARSSSEWLNDCVWLDFHAIQSGHSHGSHALKYLKHDWALVPIRPFINAEPAYEVHPNAWKNGFQGWLDDFDVRRDLYYTICSGAAGYTYGAHAIWQFHNPKLNRPINQPRLSWQQALDLPGAKQLAIAMRLLNSLPTTLRQPADEFLNTQEPPALPAVAAHDAAGAWALLYLPESQHVTVKSDIVTTKTPLCSIINPRTGQELQRFELPAAASWDIIPPPPMDGGKDCVIIIR